MSGGGEGELELDGGELAEAALAAPAVVGVLDPVDHRVAQLGASPPDPATVQESGVARRCTRLGAVSLFRRINSYGMMCASPP